MGSRKGGNCHPRMRNYGPQESEQANLKHSVLASSHRFRLQLVKWQADEWKPLSVSPEGWNINEEEQQKTLLSTYRTK